MKILLSIKPEYANKILDGTKIWEYRKSVPKKNIDAIIIYSSYPVKEIVAEVEVLKIESCNVKELWEKTNAERDGGISKEKYDKYFQNKDFGYAYKLGTIHKLSGKTLKDYGIKYPPENFCYIKNF